MASGAAARLARTVGQIDKAALRSIPSLSSSRIGTLGEAAGLLSVLVLALLIVAAVGKEWQALATSFAAVGLACLLFNLASMAVGYTAPLALRLPRRQATAIAMEIDIHNGTLAIFIALNVLQNATMSIPAAVYSLLMFFTAAAFAWFAARRGQDGDA